MTTPSYLTKDNQTLLDEFIAYLETTTDDEHDLIPWDLYENPNEDEDIYDDIEIISSSHNQMFISIYDMEFIICTDEAADYLCDEELDNYIDDCILPEIPENLHCYFNDDHFKEDALLNDGRGHIISSYDGYEREISYKDIDYFIYRIN